MIDVLVVGAGPVGLTLAIDLARRGAAVTVLETRRRGEAPSVKCNHVAARSMEIFRRLGVAAALRAAGLPASVSNSAGTFVCNHVFFGLMHRLQQRPGVRGGFMHLPLLPEQAARLAGMPSLPLATMVEGVRVALECALATQADVRLGGGAEH